MPYDLEQKDSTIIPRKNSIDKRKSTIPYKLFYVAAAGKTVKSFLQAHFIRLAESGYNVTLACSDSPQTSEVRSNTNVCYIPVTIESQIAPASDILSVLKLTAVLLKEKPEVVHTQMSEAGLVSMLSAYIVHTPLRIYHNHGMSAFSSRGAKRILLELIEKMTCKLVTQVLFCGEPTLNEAVARGFCSKDKAIVLGNGTIPGIDTNRYKPVNPVALNSSPDRRGSTNNTFTVGFIGRIVAHKGIDNIILSLIHISEPTRPY